MLPKGLLFYKVIENFISLCQAIIISEFTDCRYTETETKGNKVFTYKLLMRSKLSPDSSKLVVSTQNGYIIVIHDLDLLTLADDLKNFPAYGSPTSFPPQRNQRRNRVELIREWPSGDNASDIASLQVKNIDCTI